MTLDVTDLRTKQIKTDLFLNVLKPSILLQALVNGAVDRGAYSFNFDTGSSPGGFSSIATGMTIIFTTQYGEQRTFVRGISGTSAAGTIFFYENSLVLSNNDPFVVLHLYESFPQPPSIRSGIFYKFWDGLGNTIYSDQNNEPNPVCIMGSHRAAQIEGTTTISLQITAGADDGYTNTVAGGTFNSNANDIFFGKSGALTLNSFFRRSSISIPQGANITAATITLTSFATTAGALTVTISGNDEDNATAPTTYAGYNAKVLTSATVAWNTSETWVAETAYTSPDITAIIQEIIDRPGWASGNALMLFIKDNAGSVLRDVYSYDSTPAKSALLTISYTTPATFSLDASPSYAIADGATIVSCLWSCVHNGGGTSGIIISDPASFTPALTITEEDQYWLTCTVTDSNGKTQTGHRAIFTDPPYTDFTLQNLSGDWDSGGWKCTVNATGDITLEDFPDWTLVVLSWKVYFDDIEDYINLWGISDEILLCGYLRQDSDSDNWGDAQSGGGTAATSFSITTIEDLLNNLAQLGSVSLGAVPSPTHWYEYASWMTVGRSVHHLMLWHLANVMSIVDVIGLTDNLLGVLQTDYTEASMAQQVNGFAYNKGIFAKLCSDRLGRLHLVQDAQMLDDAGRAALDTLFTITTDDISGRVNVIRDPEGNVTFTQLDGFSFDRSTSTPFLSIMPGYRESGVSYIMPSARGGSTAQVSNQVLADQTDSNVRVGRYHALQNNNPRELRWDCPANYLGAFDIIPKWFYEWGIADAELARDTPINGRRLVCRHIEVSQAMNEDGIYSGVVGVSVVVQPEAIGPPGIEGNYPKNFPGGGGRGPAPDWNPPAADTGGDFVMAYIDALTPPNSLRLRAGRLLAGVITLGSELVPGAADITSPIPAVVNLSATKALVFYSNGGDGVARVITKADLTLTAGAEYVIGSGLVTSSAVALSATLALVCYSGGIVALGIAGDVITPGTPVAVTGVIVSGSRIDATTFIISTGDETASAPANGYIGTISGTTITLGAVDDASTGNSQASGVAALSPTLAIVAYWTATSVRVSALHSITGTTFTLGDDVELAALVQYSGGCPIIARLSESRAVIIYTDTSGAPYVTRAVAIQCTGAGVISVGSPVAVSEGTDSRHQPAVLALSGQKIIAGYLV